MKRLCCVVGGMIALFLSVGCTDSMVLAAKSVGPVTGAIFTTDADCSGVNLNIYDSKDDVYIDGGPKKPGAAGLPDGYYAVQVTEPNGTVLGTSIGSGTDKPVHVAGGAFVQCYQLSAILIRASDGSPGYDDTSNRGGEYKVWVSQQVTVDGHKGKKDDGAAVTFKPKYSKTDNFKVKEQEQEDNTFTFSTNPPDGLMAAASRQGSKAGIEIETADDFILSQQTRITGATFTGLITDSGKVPLSNISDVTVSIYHVFPKDSDTTRTPQVPTRTNSPADVEIETRDSLVGELTFKTELLNNSFTAANSVLNGINPAPNQTTGGEGAVTGQEVKFTLKFTKPLDLPADHYFFVPQVTVFGGEFYWLSAPRPIVPPGTPLATDLQAWIRNADLDPDWLRIGTDIVDGATPPTFNMTFSLSGELVP